MLDRHIPYAGRIEPLVPTRRDIMPTILELVDISGSIDGDFTPLQHVSELQTGEKAGPGVIDGRSLVRVLDAMPARGGADEAVATALVHDFLFLYCGARVAAARHGRWKVHFSTTIWEDEANQICRTSVANL